ncbi:MAG: FAD-dependent oxidoreductase, partial [Noviherbaspirillum sp.]
MHIAIIGAGIAGLTCARHLLAQGHDVIVYEKGESVGGRTSTRQTELGGFDHGAQYFTVTSERFAHEVGTWRKAGRVMPWGGRLVTLDHGVATPAGRKSENARQRLVAVPGMDALAQHL